MNSKQIEELYGTEYPDAVTMFGIRMPLVAERRFSRHYASPEPQLSTAVSRFSDGSASISLDELRQNWSDWSDADKRDFCSSCDGLHTSPEFPDILRFVMRHGDRWNWSGIASLVAHALPKDEAFVVLKAALDRTPSHESNLIQAVALTKHSDAAPLIYKRLEALWALPDMWDNASFLNWTALDALCCIQYLLELGIRPKEFENKVRLLARHLCQGNRDSCCRNLHQHYDWIPKPEPWRPPGIGNAPS